MLHPNFKRNFNRILPFGIIWLVFGIIFITIEYAATKDYEYRPEGTIELNIYVLAFALFAVTLVGITIGIIELLFVNKLFEKKTFLESIFGKLIIYSLFLFLIICITYPIAASIELQTGVFSDEVWSKFKIYLVSPVLLSTAFQMAISLVFSLFYNEIREKVGQGAFTDFLTGRYHKPKIEERIFMFLDMKSSTSIAEHIGHTKYFEFLKSYYEVLSEGVIEHFGEVYQYVGDEMVITWKLKRGLLDQNCIRCFFKMKQDLKEKQTWFESQFGETPLFKAGFHLGEVTTGEIGVLKKDVIFTGDTLNTTARIQSLCNELEVDILLSKDLLSRLELNQSLISESKGHQILKGKKEPLELFTIKYKA